MSVFQVCSRCTARWPVTGAPAQWCPHCQGVLLSPVDSERPAPPSGRNFRWVARSPYPPIGRPGGARRAAANPPGPTPRYPDVPRWGLLDPPPDEHDEAPSRTEVAADLAPTLLVCTAIVFGLAAVAETFRYGLLVFNRVRLVEPMTLAVSDAMVWATQLSAPLVALAAAVATVCRLVVTRRRAYAARGFADPRSPRALAAGSLVPGVNLVMPGVFLTEIADDRRTLLAIRAWWAVWVVDGALVVANSAWRARDTLQAQADGVLLAALTAAVAAATALLALHVLRRFDGQDWSGRPRRTARWINVPAAERAPRDREPEQEEATVG